MTFDNFPIVIFKLEVVGFIYDSLFRKNLLLKYLDIPLITKYYICTKDTITKYQYSNFLVALF